MEKRSKRLVLLLFIVFFLVVIPLMAFFGLFSRGARTGIKAKAVVLDVQGSMLDYEPQFSAGILLARNGNTQTDVLTVIDRAARDRRVGALVVRVLPSSAGAAKCDEIRSALNRFRKTGKRVIVFSPMLVNHHYLIACAADSVFMPPSGYLLLSGPASSAMFIRGTFDKLGIAPNIHRIGEYKSAAEMFTERERTPPSRRMVEQLLRDLHDRFVESVAAGRGVGEDTVRAWIDRTLFSPRNALREGLIDGVRYWDQIVSSLGGGRTELVNSREYMRSAGAISLAAPRIAVVHAQGRIVMGESGIDPVNGLTMGSETITRELRRARTSSRIDAVILRVDSPGGDALAGEMIARAVEITAREKPVVVSMSDVAASGGYEISYRADCIVALPGSVTGSIGSIIGKLNMRGLYNRIGVTKDEIGIGGKALMNSDYRDFSDEEWDVIKEEHWAFYRAWIADIARRRDMTVEEVDSLGRGRVWTGSQAIERGLIDELGGLDRALEEACDLAGIEDPSRVVLVHYPERMSLVQILLSGRLFDGTVEYALHAALQRVLAGSGPVMFRRELPESMDMR